MRGGKDDAATIGKTEIDQGVDFKKKSGENKGRKIGERKKRGADVQKTGRRGRGGTGSDDRKTEIDRGRTSKTGEELKRTFKKVGIDGQRPQIWKIENDINVKRYCTYL